MAKLMSKSKIVAHIAGKVGTPKKTVSTFFDELFKLAVKAHRKARMGRNPQTGEPIKIKAKTVVRVRAAKAFKDAVIG